MDLKTKLIILSCFAFLQTSAQHIYKIDTLYPVHSLDDFITVLPDTGQNFSIDDIRNDSTLAFIPLPNLPQPLDVHTVYWGKLKVFAEMNIDQWELHFEDRLSKNVSWVRGNGKVDVYTYIDSNLHWHQKTGADYPISDKYDQSLWLMNRIGFNLPANKAADIFIRIEGNSFGTFPYFNTSLRKNGYQYYSNLFQIESFFHIFLFGVTFIIFLYHFLQWVYLKESVFLWFSLWTFLCTITQSMTIGLDMEFIMHHFPQWRTLLWLIIPNSMLFTFWFFGRSFMQSRINHPKLDKYILTLIGFIVFELIGIVIYLLVANPQITFTRIGYHYHFVALYSIIGFALASFLTFQKDPLLKYFGIGALIATGCTLLGGLWAIGYINISYVDPYTLGIFLQTIAYSFGIAYRQQMLNKKANNEKLLVEKTKGEIARVRDLEEIKSKFFANISHEFRTPLSLILGPLKRSFSEAKSKSINQEQIVISSSTYNVITSNIHRLQNLVDQLLELSKLESGAVIINLSQGDIISYIRTLVHSFESLAERNNISLNTSFSPAIPDAYFDKDKLQKIISNLLSNALKYNTSGGAVTICTHHDPHYLHLEISDTGRGISNEDIQLIFQRFYRADSSEVKGSGIGLTLTKELIEVHDGKISVQSNVGLGTTFKVKLPISLEALPQNVIFTKAHRGFIQITPDAPEASFENHNTHSSPRTEEKGIVLLVEDNEELSVFIAEILYPHYEVLTAQNGQQGERMAFEHIPDIIISDVMMPKKDGYQLCHDLKTNPKTSHIPIILLTAKAAHENKLEGLSLGADAYLTKPFDDEELLLRLRNLIQSRQNMWQHFNVLDTVLVKDLSIKSMDDEFLQRILKTIKDQIDNEHLSVNDLASAVGFSRSQLHRKLKALTNKSANKLITEVRLNEARLMLQNKAGSVSEIAYSVGYSNMSYFTKSFKAKFGVLPSKI